MAKSSILKYLKIYEKQNGLCVYCGDRLTECNSIHLDHIIPKSNGGTLKYDNVCLCCRYCNIRKGNKDVMFIHKWMIPYKNGTVKNKLDLKDYHKLKELQSKFNN